MLYMTTWIDTLPDEIYQKIYSHLFTACAKQVAEKCALDHRHRTMNNWHTIDNLLPYATQRSNVAAVWCWLNNRPKQAHRMWTDGDTIYSYDLAIGHTRPDGYKIGTPYTARHGNYYSQTTSQHSNLVARFADDISICP
jgi:hypothetical protein